MMSANECDPIGQGKRGTWNAPAPKGIGLLAVLAAVVTMGIPARPALADPSGTFNENYDIEVSGGISFTGATITMLVGSVPVPAYCIGQFGSPPSYANPFNWTSANILMDRIQTFTDLADGSVTIVELGTEGADVPLAHLADGLGPTESDLKVGIPLHMFGIPATIEVGTKLKYHVTVDDGRSVFVDQSPKILSLTVGSTSTVEIDSGHPITIDSYVENNGILRKSAGNGTSIISVRLTNDGSVESTAGTLRLTGPYSGAGGFRAANDGVLDLRNTRFTSSAWDFRTEGDGRIALSGSSRGTLTSGTVLNQGSITLLPAGFDSVGITVTGEVTLAGGGQVTLSSPGSSGCYISGGAGTNRLINADNTISGDGVISGVELVNSGIFDGNVRFGELGIRNQQVTNTGTMQASNEGTLLLEPVIDNAGGTIQALADSTVKLRGARITGGTFVNTATGTILARGGTSTLATLLDNSAGGQVLIGGQQPAGTTLTLHNGLHNGAGGNILVYESGLLEVNGGTITNAGVMRIAASGFNSSSMRITGGEVTLTGGGTVTLSSPSTGTGFIFGGAGTDRLVNVDNTISGGGVISNIELVNSGIFDANVRGELGIRNQQVTNTGTMQASNEGTLLLEPVIDNADGTIQALADSTVKLRGARITGGTFLNTATGTIWARGGTSTLATLLDNSAGGQVLIGGQQPAGTTLTLHNGLQNGAGGDILVYESGQLEVNGGTITNAGVMRIASEGSNGSSVRIAGGEVTLTGGGTVTLSSPNIASSYISGGARTDRLVNVDNTISGGGGISNMELVNSGILDANVRGELGIRNELVTNTGTMQASNEGTLLLEPTIDNTGGTIQALADSTVLLRGAHITGGTFLNTATGTIWAHGGTSTLATLLDNSAAGQVLIGGHPSLASTLSLHDGLHNGAGGEILVYNRGTLEVNAGMITNAGAMEISSSGSYASIVRITGGEVALTGGGTVTLSPGGSSGGFISGGANTDRLVNVDNTISGCGVISNIELVNSGVLDANARIGELGIRNELVTNTGTMQASNEGVLVLEPAIDNTGGTIQALADSTVQLRGAQITGGTFLNTATGTIWAHGGTSTLATLLDNSAAGQVLIGGHPSLASTLSLHDGLHNGAGGEILVYNRGTLEVNAGMITNAGAMEISSSGSYSSGMRITGGEVTLTGGGTVTLSPGGSSGSYISGGAGTDRLVNVDNTISGAGNFGSNSLSILNRGTVRGDGAHALIIDPQDSIGFTNAGRLEAVGRGGVTLRSGAFTTSGHVLIAADSSMTRQGDYVQTAGSTIVNGILDVTGLIDIRGGVLGGEGTVVAGGGVTVSNLAPGNSVAALNIDGDLTLRAGSAFNAEAIGGELDSVGVTGVVTIGANASLNILISGGGNEFNGGANVLIDALGGVDGTFANVTQLNAYVTGNGLTYDPAGGTVTLTLNMNLNPGDANLDGATDVSDRIIWNENNFTFDTTFVTGDFNNDGATDVLDRIIWNSSNFTVATVTPPRPIVPEPATIGLLGLGGIVIILCRRRPK